MFNVSEYDIILKKEILREAFAGILADFFYILKKNNISDEDRNNPLVALYWQIADVYQHILGSRYNTMQDMIEVQGQYKFFKHYMETLR